MTKSITTYLQYAAVMLSVLLLPVFSAHAGADVGSARQQIKGYLQSEYQRFYEDDSSTGITFSVDAPVDGCYYMEFWLNPECRCGTFARYSVLLNGSPVGEIIPEKGNWQSITIKDTSLVSLVKGTNEVTIKTEGSSVPLIEGIRFSQYQRGNLYDDAPYEEYLEEARCASDFNPYDADVLFDMESNSAVYDSSSNSLTHTLLLRYTFQAWQNLKEGYELEISTSSRSQHVVDIVYLGYANSYIIPGGSSSENGVNLSEKAAAPGLPAFFNYATPDEMQGLNWLVTSKYEVNNSVGKYVGKRTVRIPKSGYYYIRVRPLGKKYSTVADVSIGNSTYTNMPIYFDYFEPSLIINNEVVIYTNSYDASTDNPVLCAHLNRGERVAAYAEDSRGESVIKNNLGLSNKEAILAQSFKHEISKISVNNYSSSSPISQCDVTVQGMTDVLSTPKSVRRMAKSGVDGIKFLDDNVSVVFDGNDIRVVSNQYKILSLRVTGIDGNCIISKKCNEHDVSLNLDDLKACHPRLFILEIETVSSVTVKKILI